MKRVIIATRNRGKLKELKERLESLDCEVTSLADFNDRFEVEEDADTFEGNALKKARAVFELTGLPTLADDSGLEVDALERKPGVHSARYGGSGLDDSGRCELLLNELAHVPPQKRTARFRAALVYLAPGESPVTFHGDVEGRIGLELSGEHGFGYDPVFIPEGYRDTMAALGPEIKGRISHRAKALDAFVDYFRDRMA